MSNLSEKYAKDFLGDTSTWSYAILVDTIDKAIAAAVTEATADKDAEIERLRKLLGECQQDFCTAYCSQLSDSDDHFGKCREMTAALDQTLGEIERRVKGIKDG